MHERGRERERERETWHATVKMRVEGKARGISGFATETIAVI
jgi:hypothetical protein